MKHAIGSFIRWLLMPIDKIYTHRCLKRLKNKDFSILCNCCIGGSMYHRVGHKFLSPTINLSIEPLDFIKFLNKINYYLGLKLEEQKSDKKWPVAKLGDILIDFVHYKNFEEAVECWERRKTRLNFNNLYIVIRDIRTNQISDIDIENLKIKYKNIVVLTEKKNRGKYFCSIKLRKNQKEHYRNLCNIHIWEAKWDWINFLNH